MLIHHLSRGAPKGRLAGQHLPEHNAQRIQVRADIHAHSGELLRTSKLWCTSKASKCRNLALRTWFTDKLSQAKIDDFRRQGTFSLQVYHDVAWFDVPVNEVLLVHR